ncbi:DEAD/DEAH box helicase [Corynebacterium aquatimens]|uniref:SNF2 family DNA or RNA helicase n=1 Tax=Corynebacterium aquatimens TaxID=1190508 RepID=A0A931GSZ0_9CORY|nr:DEAD/DEAH box helicase [Corynebacterium aquatimens]MBG6121335.1 SNF2 family DNA or RNA helicase [Corynebacterium aquatimens]
MPNFLLHGLLLSQSGFCVWVERVEGHKLVLPSQVPSGTFPPGIEAMLNDAKFRQREPVKLRTPRGKELTLRIPSAALSPEDTVRFLDQLVHVDQAGPGVTAVHKGSIAPDLLWFIHLYRGLNRFINAGRVSVHMPNESTQWYPQWKLGAGLDERTWLADMVSAAPGVITINNPELIEDLAHTFVHWIVSTRLAPLLEMRRAYPWHEFAESLLKSEPLRRGNSDVARALNQWNGSITAVNTQLVFIVEEPWEDYETARWPVRARVRAGTDAPQPIRLDRLDPAVIAALREQLNKAISITSLLDPMEHPRMLWEEGVGPGFGADVGDGGGSRIDVGYAAGPASPEDGDWDCYLTTAEVAELVATHAPRLRVNNIPLMLPRSWSKAETTARLKISREADGPDSLKAPKLGFDQLLTYDWSVSVGDIELSEEEMRKLIASKSGLIRLRGQWVMADTDSLRSSRKYMEALAGKEVEEGVITARELRQLALESAVDNPVEITGDAGWITSLVGGTDRPAPERQDIPETVEAELRDYQRRGVDWLYFMSRNNVGAVLADDMGLGKTLQLLILLAVERAHGTSTGPTLVIAPTSVVGNWAREAARFVPDLTVAVHHGSSRAKGKALVDKCAGADLVITSYGVASRDHKDLAQISWDHVVLDEAQAIKNTATKASRSVRAIPARHRIALTGTPVENRLSELRSILDFVNPGLLGSATFFRNHFAKAIESRRDEQLADAMQERLRRLTAPFVMRRLKSDPAIIDDLPDKIEHVVPVDMTKEQAALYTALVEDMEAQLGQREGIERKGLVLTTITRIKQICNHPAHFLGDGSAVTDKGRHRSGKVAMLMELIDQAIETDQRVLVFTQYKAFGDILQPYLSQRLGHEVPFLHGGVTKTAREKMVDDFQAGAGGGGEGVTTDGPRVMILSLRAGGTGINLTAASMVIHMDRWWNPAVENQATDRAYRIGQNKNVQVYKMITKGTLEESIQDILDGKLQLAGAVVGEGEGWITELDAEDLRRLMTYRKQG